MSDRRSAWSGVSYCDSGSVRGIQVPADDDRIAQLGIEARTGENDYAWRLVDRESCASCAAAVTVVPRPGGFDVV